MTTIRTRIARLTAASLLTLGLGAVRAGPASASYSSWAGSAPPESSVAAEGEPVSYSIGRGGGVHSVIILADDASRTQSGGCPGCSISIQGYPIEHGG